MKTAVLSDIHGNAEALDAVLASCRSSGAERVVCLGDIVGYGADPIACMERTLEAAEVVIAGNHDRAAAGLEDLGWMNDVAASAIKWTMETLDASHQRYLAERPFTVREGQTLFVHASPLAPERWHYIFTASEAAVGLDSTDADLAFVGHSHRAFVYVEGEGEVVATEGRTTPGGRCLVNVGSVGQPRDHDPRASYCMYDDTDGTVELMRVPYDVASAQARIRDAGLPAFLADRLGRGH